jgi:hypothetical protein
MICAILNFVSDITGEMMNGNVSLKKDRDNYSSQLVKNPAWGIDFLENEAGEEKKANQSKYRNTLTGILLSAACCCNMNMSMLILVIYCIMTMLFYHC